MIRVKEIAERAGGDRESDKYMAYEDGDKHQNLGHTKLNGCGGPTANLTKLLTNLSDCRQIWSEIVGKSAEKKWG